MWGEGTVLAGRYQLRQRIGGGSMGDVWRALDTVLGREVAVKILLPALLDDAGFAARFHTEARVLAALSHPGIVSVFDYGEADDPRTAFLVMELITGRPLSDLLDESAPLSEATTLTIVAQTLEALQAAHDQGIVHRDVKPANLMLRGGTVVVTDFGVARTADARRLTAADVVLGTAVYAAPEQARHTAVTAAADQYAVGVIAYEMLTGAPPFDSGTPLGIMMKHLQEPVPPLPDTVSAPVRALVMRALAKDPAERFASAREMAETARRLAALPASLTRIGTPQDSFQTGVDVAAVEAAAAAAPRADGDFLSFTVLPRAVGVEAEAAAAADEGDGEGAEELSPAADEQPMPVESSPVWASYAVRPSADGAEGADWASFTVRGGVEAAEPEPTVPLPDAEEDAGSVPADVSGGGGEVRDLSRRVVPQDSFMAGMPAGAVDEALAVAVEGGRSRGKAKSKAAKRQRAAEQKAAEERAAEQKAAGQKAVEAKQKSAEPTEAAFVAPQPQPQPDEPKSSVPQPAEPKSAESQPAKPRGDAPQLTAPKAAKPDPAALKAAAPMPEQAEVKPAEPKTAESKAAAPEPTQPKQTPPKKAEPERVTGKEARARIAPGHAMPLDSFTAGVDLDSVAETEEPAPQRQRRRVGVLAAVGAAVVVAIAVAYPLSHNNSSASATVAATQGTSSESTASSSSSSSSAASAPSTLQGAVLPPVSSSSASVPHKTGAITNVGDGDAIDVFSTTAGAPLYADGAQLTVDPPAGREGQSFQATALTAGGHPAYEFGVGLDTDELLDAGSGKVALKHCACGSPAQPPTQLWSLSQDTSTPSGAFYLNSQGLAGQCLTDNGPSIALSLKPCVAGNKAQQWYLP